MRLTDAHVRGGISLRRRLPSFVIRHPALSLFLLAVLLGPSLVAPVLLGLIPRQFVQLGALSASAAGLILAAIEGGPDAVREVLRRGLVWRVGFRWWLIALFLPVAPALGALYWTVIRDGGRWPLLEPWYRFALALIFQGRAGHSTGERTASSSSGAGCQRDLSEARKRREAGEFRSELTVALGDEQGTPDEHHGRDDASQAPPQS